MSVDEPAEQRGTRASQKCGNLGVAAAAGLWRQTADFNGMHQHLPPPPIHLLGGSFNKRKDLREPEDSKHLS